MANNKPASTYAQPHTMGGKGVNGELPAESLQVGTKYMDEMNISAKVTTLLPRLLALKCAVVKLRLKAKCHVGQWLKGKP